MAEYPDFETVTGWTDILGLGGVNCRHSWGSFFPDIEAPPSETELQEQRERDTTTKPYTSKNRQGEDVTKEYTRYEANQEQRRQEREMRYTRRRAVAMKEAGQDTEYIALRARYTSQRREYERFSDAMSIQPKWGRITIDGLGRI